MATYASISGVDPDAVSDFLLTGLHEMRKLADVVSAVREDITREAGDTVRVAALGSATVGTQNTPGGALAATDTGYTNTAITLQKHFAREDVPTEVWEDQDPLTEARLLSNHAAGLAEQVDQDILDALEAATPGASEDLATAGNYDDIYDQIVECKAGLKALKVEPDFLIGNPDVEAALLKSVDEGVVNRSIRLAADGSVAEVAGLRFIVHANAPGELGETTLDAVQAILIDSSRAVGEAWGRRPAVDTDFDVDSDTHNYLTTIRYGTAVIDETSVGHVKNPSA